MNPGAGAAPQRAAMTTPADRTGAGEEPYSGDPRTDLAIERSRLAAERTLMAWIRTSLSMISFGFTIYKFFQYLSEAPGVAGSWRPQGAFNLGKAMVVLGVLLLAPAVVQHGLFIRRLGQRANRRLPVSLALIAAWLILLIGIGALLNLFLRVGPF
jgi:putative membrane protein